MLRILFADDQIPDDEIPDDEVFADVLKRYPGEHGFARAFLVMRQAVNTVREGNDVTIARRFDDALSLIREQDFDLAIIDLGWFTDDTVPEAHREAAGWRLADAIDQADAHRPGRLPTAQIIYSARLEKNPEISERAANKGKLPFLKPYEQTFTIPLGSPELKVKESDRVDAACRWLRATVSFVEHTRTSEERLDRDLNAMRQAVVQGWQDAVERERRWDRLTRTLLTMGVLLVFIGVLAALFFGIPQGTVTAVSGVIVSLIPRLLYSELDKTRKEIRSAKDDIEKWLEKVRSSDSSSSTLASPGP
jgi:hypothetical protein